MNTKVSPVVALVLILIVLGSAGFFFWKQTASPGSEQGRLQSDVDMSKMEKDPEKFRQGMEELLKRDKASRQNR